MTETDVQIDAPRNDPAFPAEGRSTAALWAAFLPRLLARTALMAIGGMLVWAVLPVLIGWHATTVMSDSMAPRLLRGDIVVSLPMSGDHVSVGQVALFDDPDHPGRLRMHRVIAVGEGHVLTTKGDANPSADSTPVEPSAVHGVGVMRVPYLGYPIVWLHEGDLVPLALVGSGLAGLVALALPAASDRRHGRHRTSGTNGRSGTRARGLAHPVALGVAFLAAGAVVASTVATPAHASFTSQAGTPSSTLAAASSFSCLTDAPATPAYLYYGFGETSGTQAADSSGNGRTGTLHGGVTHTAGSCAAGDAPALTLDGSSGYVTAPGPILAPSTFTLSLWFKTTSTTGGLLMGFGSSATGASGSYDRHVYLSNDGRLNFGDFYFFGYDTITSARSYNDGAWHQVTATLSSAGMHLYVDGQQVAQNTLVTGDELNIGYWRIGYDNVANWPNAPTSGYFKGSISDAAVYSTALSASAVASDYAAGR